MDGGARVQPGCQTSSTCLQVSLLWHSASCHASSLAQAMSAAADSAAACDAPGNLPEQLRQAAQQLPGLGNPQETEQLLQRAAALMHQYYALPAVVAELRLAVAQAAAGRSCAYLRCANLGGEGGPAAGQGVGSMRCRWAGWWQMACIKSRVQS